MIDDVGVNQVVDGGQVLLPDVGFALLSHLAVDQTGRFGVSTTAFDAYEELLWTGSTGGTVVSYYGPALDKYTAFRIVPNGGHLSDVRDLLTIEQGVLSLSAKRLKCNRRHGTNHFNLESTHFSDMHCMHRTNAVPGSLILGGNQKKLLKVDLETRKEQRVFEMSRPNCMSIRSNSTFFFTSDTTGNITLRSPQSLEAIQSMQAHQGPVVDFDVCGAKLVTCGYSPSEYKEYEMRQVCRRRNGRRRFTLPQLNEEYIQEAISIF